MSDDQQKAIEQLERRVETLENMVRRLTFVATRGQGVPAEAPTPQARPVVRASLPSVAAAPPPPHKPDTDLEQWFGQRGLLAVGVIALLAATAFFLKYAIDRGWIAPLVRSLLAILAGVAVAIWAHQRIARGMRRYGAALIGAGGGLVFLGVWAAAGPYALVDRRVGILLLAITTVAVTLLALHHQVEGLAIWALFGAYLAPPLLRPTDPNPTAYLGYIEIVGLGTGILAYTMNWRRTFNLALFGYLILAGVGASTVLGTPTGCWLLAAAGVLTLHVTHERAWPEARFGVLLLSWIILAAVVGGSRELGVVPALVIVALVPVAGLLFWQHLQRDPFRADANDELTDQVLFIANPLAFIWVTFTLLDTAPPEVAAILALPYLIAGLVRRRASFLIMGFALAALAIVLQWPTPGGRTTIGWTSLALLALLAERNGERPGGRHAAVGLATAAFAWQFTFAWLERVSGAAATSVFSDSWALALYALIAGTAAAAHWWGNEAKPTLWKGGGAEWLWMLCAATVFIGGSIEFAVAFGHITALAGDLALSVWWLLYAGALVWLGFDLEKKFVRSGGLIVAAGAGLKIVLYDLSTLEALYRVASFFALALIALAVAYAYNRRAKASEA